MEQTADAHGAAHPRAGGENGGVRGGDAIMAGSSPRGRGKLAQVLEVELNQRLIPARAGKTASDSAPSSTPPAHPRAGGENGRFFVGNISVTGSSPRGRGKLTVPRGLDALHRLIPARAGKTGCRWR